MLLSIIAYLFLQLHIIVVSIAITRTNRKNRLKPSGEDPPDGFEETSEIFIDPTTNEKQVVWVNSQTGDRYYKTISK